MITERLEKTLAAFDAANLQDPNTEIVNGKDTPKEWIYSQRMTNRLHKFYSSPSEILQLAARCQHICRWQIPRSNYPMDKQGYKQWRNELAIFHGNTAANIMLNNGYEEVDTQRIKDLLQKRSLKRDEEVQTLEDVICLVFLEFYLADFATKHDEEKLIDIIRKTWNKMSEQGHKAALELQLTPDLQNLVGKALGA